MSNLPNFPLVLLISSLISLKHLTSSPVPSPNLVWPVPIQVHQVLEIIIWCLLLVLLLPLPPAVKSCCCLWLRFSADWFVFKDFFHEFLSRITNFWHQVPQYANKDTKYIIAGKKVNRPSSCFHSSFNSKSWFIKY